MRSVEAPRSDRGSWEILSYGLVSNLLAFYKPPTIWRGSWPKPTIPTEPVKTKGLPRVHRFQISHVNRQVYAKARQEVGNADPSPAKMHPG